MTAGAAICSAAPLQPEGAAAVRWAAAARVWQAGLAAGEGCGAAMGRVCGRGLPPPLLMQPGASDGGPACAAAPAFSERVLAALERASERIFAGAGPKRFSERPFAFPTRDLMWAFGASERKSERRSTAPERVSERVLTAPEGVLAASVDLTGRSGALEVRLPEIGAAHGVVPLLPPPAVSATASTASWPTAGAAAAQTTLLPRGCSGRRCLPLTLSARVVPLPAGASDAAGATAAGSPHSGFGTCGLAAAAF